MEGRGVFTYHSAAEASRNQLSHSHCSTPFPPPPSSPFALSNSASPHDALGQLLALRRPRLSSPLTTRPLARQVARPF